MLLSIISGAKKIPLPQRFQWAPTLRGECYSVVRPQAVDELLTRFNGHPPLGVNATLQGPETLLFSDAGFQWAPTLRGECY